VEYRYCQTWVFVGNFILEDLIMMFKFYQIWDSKFWYLPFESSVLFGFKSLIVKSKLEKRNSSTFNFDDDIDNDNNNNNNNNNNNSSSSNNRDIYQE
jgi:hypothetical protein